MRSITSASRNGAAQPLSLYHLLDPEVLANPYPLYRRLREESPVHWDPFLSAWVVTGYTNVMAVLTKFSALRTPAPEQLAALGLSELGPIAEIMVRQMLFMDAPQHTRLRRLAAYAFRPARVASLSARIQEITDDLIDKFAPAGRVEIMKDFAVPLPAIVTAEMLGVPVADSRQLTEWSADFAEMLGNFQHNPDRASRVRRSVQELVKYFKAHLRKMEQGCNEGLVHSLAIAEVDGDRFSEEEVIANSILTMVGGQETTTNLIGNGLLTLLRYPDQMHKLLANPGLMGSAVEECLRYESPSQHTARKALTDMPIGKITVRAGQAVIAVMGAANRDPEAFPDPDRFDITRTDNRHLAFGWAAHFCFGAALARIEGKIAFSTLLRRLPGPKVDPVQLEWRENLGLRGLKRLPLTFNGSTGKAFEADADPQPATNV
ncbi:MAG: cytochrome P450 [Acidobacteriia bacterium]|nr:cytochrome P450 [Terriglobia bacterium]